LAAIRVTTKDFEEKQMKEVSVEPTSTPSKAPRYWTGIDELNPSYWSDSKAQEKRGQEFFDKPIEALERLEKLDATGVSRRDFLTVMGAGMAMASFACARRPVNKIIPYVVQPQEVTPGVPLHYASTCQECSKGCGILVKTREGRPIKIEGNDRHPSNEGSLCSQGQASVLSLYDPDRLKGPVHSQRSGKTAAISWTDFDSATVKLLKSARSVRLLTGATHGPSTRKAGKEFLSSFPNASWVEVDVLAEHDLYEAAEVSYGRRVDPRFHFEKADVVLSVGADFLGTWGNHVENSRQWSKRRKLLERSDTLSQVFVAEGNLSITGASADVRLPILSGGEAAFLGALARELILDQKKTRFAGQPEVVSFLGSLSKDQMLSKAGGVSREKIVEVANALYEARGKSLVVAGGSFAAQILANLLNSALENEGVTVDGTSEALDVLNSSKRLSQLIAELETGVVDVLIVQGVNPAYFLPEASRFANALKKVKTVIAIADRIDETAFHADYIGAENHSLESWGDARASSSVYSLSQPTISPIHDTRSFGDQLIAWVRAGVPASGLLAKVAANSSASFYDFVKENWKTSLFSMLGRGKSFLDFWETTLQEGVVRGSSPSVFARSFNFRSLSTISAMLKASESPSITLSRRGPVTEASGVALQLYTKGSIGDGRMANNAWLQELPEPMSSLTWDNCLNVSVALAKEMDLVTNDVVRITGAGGAALDVPVLVQPGLLKGTAALAVGYGRTAAGKVGNKVGVNAFSLASVDPVVGLSLSGLKVSFAKTGKKYELAMTQAHHRLSAQEIMHSKDRPIVNDISFAAWKKNPEAEKHTDPHLRLKEVPTLWNPPFDYSTQPYRWGMAIDLNSCTGCGACVVACQAENNTPVVGRDRVRESREMHWLRIDRYYSGSVDQPSVIFQPMTCQQCENAPCETVCPVLATTHSEDGLNQMTYSRCVGTRYCQNNCPYKVRRFNFFDHWKDYKDTMNMVWNPDVTVRSRGIMEKCTFCVQRINTAKGKAKDLARPIPDGELKTACQQTCPTDAIIFGNINDPKSKVSIYRENPRAFRVLEILNTKPMISYMTKVRNIEEQAEDHHANGHHS
jgi:MoCo/4Fe-4S cofactor protein with predicted Tat translocation signal